MDSIDPLITKLRSFQGLIPKDGPIPDPKNSLKPMAPEDIMCLTNILMVSSEGKSRDMLDSLIKEGNVPSIKMLISRLKYYGYTIEQFDPAVLILIACICISPGEVVMWAYSLVRHNIENGSKFTILQYLDLFQQNIPSRSYYSAIWDEQKVGSDNLLDKVHWNFIDVNLV